MRDNKAAPENRKIIWRYIQILQILLFAVAIFLPIHVGFEHLDIKSIVNMSLDWMAMFVLIVIFRNCYNGRILNNTNEILGYTIAVYLCAFFEVGIWEFDTIASLRFLNYTCNICCNCSVLIGAYLYFIFIRKSPGVHTEIFPWMKKSLFFVMIVGILAELFNFFGGYFYVVDENGVYSRSPYGSFLGFLPFVVIILGSALFILRQNLDRHTKMTYLSYSILPFLCGLWYTVTGFPPTFFVATAMTVLLIHGDIYVVQTKQSEFFELDNAKKEAEYALSRNMLMLSQIKPHFLYNVLGSIEVLTKLDPPKAGEAIHHFTHYLRSNMDIVKSGDTVPFSKELEHIRNYMWLEQMRFEDELEFTEEIATSDFSVPQLSIQPLVENAIKHGMMGNQDGVLHVKLTVWDADDFITVCVCDDGCGFDPEKLPEDGRSHLGLSSSAYSIKAVLGGTMDIDSRIGEGTTITIRIPKPEKTNERPAFDNKGDLQ